jgi:hypothetical protein
MAIHVRRRILLVALAAAVSAAGLGAASIAPVSAATTVAETSYPTTGPQLPYTTATEQPFGHTSDGTPEYRITSNVVIAHACVVVGQDGYGNQGVDCADIIAGPNVNGNGIVVFPQAEAICQNSAGDTVQCAGADITFNLNDHQGSPVGKVTGICGHYGGGPCLSNARTYFYDDTTIVESGCSSEVWTVVWSGSIVELPQSASKPANVINLGSSHAVACNP